MSGESMPSLAEFLAAPLAEIAKVAPATMVYGVGGTRRQAAFAGIEPWSTQFAHWARAGSLRSIDLIFRHGVRNLLLIAFSPGNFKEADNQREQMMEKLHWFLAGPETTADYLRFGWRVRLLGTESVPELKVTAEHLCKVTPMQSRHTLYWTVVPNEESPWEQLLAATQRSQAKTRTEAVLALYGEDIPPATLYLAFGKPVISLDLIPPLLVGQVQCYWSQQPGYTLTETQLRMILYDYAYLRPTWHDSKGERAKAALAQRPAWQDGPLLGLGMRLGPFWYPAPMFSPAWPNAEEV
jgi:hypothetical protein